MKPFLFSNLVPVHRAREAFVYALANRQPNPNQIRLLIFAQGRTGSTVLENLIASSGTFASYGELLGGAGSGSYFPVRYIEGHARLQPNRNFVAHVKHYHLTRDRSLAGKAPIDPHRFLSDLVQRDYRLLFLRRENMLRHVVSNWIAQERGSFHKTNDDAVNMSIRVDKERLRRALSQKEEFAIEERAAIEGLPHKALIYERDLENPENHQQTADAVMQFLGLEKRPVSTRLYRINSRPLDQLIVNYDEVRDWTAEFGRSQDLQSTARS